MSQPSVTLYVQNLNTRVKKEDIRSLLYTLFSAYGKVIDVVHTRTAQSRNAAFVVFTDLTSSTSALKSLNDESFLGRPLRVSYSRSVSYATIAADEGPEAVYAIKQGFRTVDKASNPNLQSKVTVSNAQIQADLDSKKRERENGGSAPEEDDHIDKKAKADDDDDMMQEDSDEEDPVPLQTATVTATLIPAVGTVPSPVLYIQNLPTEVTANLLYPLFEQYPGLYKITMLPREAGSATGTAFAQYDNSQQAELAKEALDGFLLTKEVAMSVNWASRKTV